MKNHELYKIIELSKKEHKGQTYGKDKRDYFTSHIEPVVSKAVEIAKKINFINDKDIFNINMIKAVAYLHDIVEDHIAIEELDKFILRNVEDNDEFYDVMWAVEQLTHIKDHKTYFKYVNDIISDYAIIVKLADLNVNIENSYKGFKKLDLYLFAREVLREKLKKIIKMP